MVFTTYLRDIDEKQYVFSAFYMGLLKSW